MMETDVLLEKLQRVVWWLYSRDKDEMAEAVKEAAERIAAGREEEDGQGA